MTIAAKSKEAIQKVKDDLRQHFKLRKLGPTSFLLGVEIKRDILDALGHFNMSDCNPVTTPMLAGSRVLPCD